MKNSPLLISIAKKLTEKLKNIPNIYAKSSYIHDLGIVTQPAYDLKHKAKVHEVIVRNNTLLYCATTSGMFVKLSLGKRLTTYQILADKLTPPDAEDKIKTKVTLPYLHRQANYLTAGLKHYHYEWQKVKYLKYLDYVINDEPYDGFVQSAAIAKSWVVFVVNKKELAIRTKTQGLLYKLLPVPKSKNSTLTENYKTNNMEDQNITRQPYESTQNYELRMKLLNKQEQNVMSCDGNIDPEVSPDNTCKDGSCIKRTPEERSKSVDEFLLYADQKHLQLTIAEAEKAIKFNEQIIKSCFTQLEIVQDKLRNL